MAFFLGLSASNSLSQKRIKEALTLNAFAISPEIKSRIDMASKIKAIEVSKALIFRKTLIDEIEKSLPEGTIAIFPTSPLFIVLLFGYFSFKYIEKNKNFYLLFVTTFIAILISSTYLKISNDTFKFIPYEKLGVEFTEEVIGDYPCWNRFDNFIRIERQKLIR